MILPPPYKTGKRMIYCRQCKDQKEHCAKGLCKKCYQNNTDRKRRRNAPNPIF